MKIIKILSLSAFMILISSCNKEKFPKNAVLKIYHFEKNGDKYISDTLVQYFDNNNRILKIFNPLKKLKKYEKPTNDTYHFVYDDNGRLVREYSFIRYSEDDFYNKDKLNDSTAYIYKGDKIEQININPHSQYRSKTVKFKYKDNRIISKYTEGSLNDSIVYNYPTRDSIIEKKYYKNELCYTREIKLLSKYDSIIKISFNKSSRYCGYNTGKILHKKYSSDGQKLMFEKINGSKKYYNYQNNRLVSICNDSLSNNCSRNYFYEDDKHGNWVKKTERYGSVILSIETRNLTY